MIITLMYYNINTFREIKIKRENNTTPWGIKLDGGKSTNLPMVVTKVYVICYIINVYIYC